MSIIHAAIERYAHNKQYYTAVCGLNITKGFVPKGCSVSKKDRGIHKEVSQQPWKSIIPTQLEKIINTLYFSKGYELYSTITYRDIEWPPPFQMLR